MKTWDQKISWIWIFFLILSAIWGGLKQSSIEAHHLARVLEPGFDAFGRNCAFLLCSAMSESLRLMFPLGTLCIATSLGLSSLALFKNPRAEFLLRTFLDTLSSLPGFLIALALGVLFPKPIFTFAFGALLMVVPSLTRIFESQILKLRSEAFVQASVALGATHPHLWFQHFQPELIQLFKSILPFVALRLLLLETSLSFLGLGVTPQHETWGKLLYQGKDYLIEAPWIMAITGVPLCFTLMSFHLLSREDPH